MIETLKDVTEINGQKIVQMDKLKEQFPEKFSEVNDNGNISSRMDYAWFEREIRPNNFIYVRQDVHSVSFTIQEGSIKEAGVNGCQVTDMIAVALHMIKGMNEKFPCRENSLTITKLEEALMWQEARTRDREKRNVEGLSQK